MEREIKFRVWDNDFNEYTSYHLGVALVRDINKYDRFLFEQFTGLKDKNGKEIYEGDILDNDSEVVFSKEQACFFAGTVPLCMSNSHRAITGNIHEKAV